MLTPDTQATLLLAGVFPNRANDAAPLTPSEFARLARWLVAQKLTPESLLEPQGCSAFADGITEHQLGIERIEQLLARGLSVALATDKYADAGIWITGVFDELFPRRLSEKLLDRKSPLLFGIGKHTLLKHGGVAVVGSRKADEASLVFARRVGELCAQQGVAIVSGGAKGVDLAAMTGALEAGGTAIGVLASQLAREATSAEAREYIGAGQLTLVTPFSPDAPFNAGNAMARNKYIYALADYAIVVSSDVETGGTWSGAVENLQHKFCPLFVRDGDDVPDGNRRLQKKGAVALRSEQLTSGGEFLEFLDLHAVQNESPSQTSLFPGIE